MQRGDPLIVATFALHLADGYTEARFDAGELDYAAGGQPIELWGRPDNVVRAVELHNRAVRSVAERDAVALVDLATELPRGGRHFTDVCHLTDDGRQEFAQRLAREVAHGGD